MAFKYLTYTKNSAISATTPVRVYTPIVIDGVRFGLSNPFTYAHRRELSGRQIATRVNQSVDYMTPAMTIGVYENLYASGIYSTDNWVYTILVNDSDVGYDTIASYCTEIPTYKLHGKRKIKDTPPNFNNTGVDYRKPSYVSMVYSKNGLKYIAACNISIDGTHYDGIGFSRVTNANNSYGEITLELFSGNVVRSYTYSQMATELSGKVIDFGAETELPEILYNWVIAVSEVVYDNEYTIESRDGTVIGVITDAAPIDGYIFTVSGNDAEITFHTINDTVYHIAWTSKPPEGLKLTSLEYSTGTITIGESVVDIQESTIFIEQYDYYDPIYDPIDIYLYQNTAEPNRVDKTGHLTDVFQLRGVLRDECSLLAPSIIFESSTYLQFNYVYIPAFGRYYFVAGIDSVSKNLWRMRLICDVLMTYRTEIQQLNAVIDRQEYYYNEMLNDANMPAQVNKTVEVIEVPSSDILGGGTFNTQDVQDIKSCNFILLTVGEGATQ